MGKTVNVAGATGLVGRELVRILINNGEVDKIRLFVRRKSGFEGVKIEEHIIDFLSPETMSHLLTGDVLFSSLGTTLKQAGSKAAQYQVDYTFQYQFAQIAARNGIPVYVLVSSAGANPRSLIFYSRIKGVLEEKAAELPFRSIAILRPSILKGKREIPRSGEQVSTFFTGFFTKFFFRKYRPVPAQTVAKSMIQAAFEKQIPGVRIVNAGEIFSLAGE